MFCYCLSQLGVGVVWVSKMGRPDSQTYYKTVTFLSFLDHILNSLYLCPKDYNIVLTWLFDQKLVSLDYTVR